MVPGARFMQEQVCRFMVMAWAIARGEYQKRRRGAVRWLTLSCRVAEHQLWALPLAFVAIAFMFVAGCRGASGNAAAEGAMESRLEARGQALQPLSNGRLVVAQYAGNPSVAGGAAAGGLRVAVAPVYISSADYMAMQADFRDDATPLSGSGVPVMDMPESYNFVETSRRSLPSLRQEAADGAYSYGWITGRTAEGIVAVTVVRRPAFAGATLERGEVLRVAGQAASDEQCRGRGAFRADSRLVGYDNTRREWVVGGYCLMDGPGK